MAGLSVVLHGIGDFWLTYHRPLLCCRLARYSCCELGELLKCVWTFTALHCAHKVKTHANTTCGCFLLWL